ncbi:MAG TPA: MBL fold metallo-hydrolase [Mycobacterium sp.]|nr:MBL fold metallo-hydrolase [Mycobacterium sp.]
MHFDWEPLTDSVHRCRLPFLDVTVGLVQGFAGVLLVDTGTTLAEASAINADVLQLAEHRVTHVVLTHKHFDHVLGSSAFADAEIYCMPEVADHLLSATDELRDDALRYGADAAEIDRAIAALRPPDHAVDNAVVDLGDRQVRITHLGRGHTDADLVVVVPADDSGPSVVFAEMMARPDEGFDAMAPENISPLVVWLGSTESHDVTGKVFEVEGGVIRIAEGWAHGPQVDKGARWDPAELGPVVSDLLAKSRPPVPVYAAGS